MCQLQPAKEEILASLSKQHENVVIQTGRKNNRKEIFCSQEAC